MELGSKIPKTIPKNVFLPPKYAFLTVLHSLTTKKRRSATKTAFFPRFRLLQNLLATVKRHPVTDDRKLKNQHSILHYFGHNF